MNNSERLEYIDIAKGIGIFMVVFTHSPIFIPVIDQMSKITIWVGAFHMPLFFIICGFTVKSPTNIDSLKKFFIKKWGGVGIPYLLWAIMYSGLKWSSVKYILIGTNISLYYAGSNSVLWFLTAYFVSNIFYGIASVISYRINHKKLFWMAIIGLCIVIDRLCKFVWTPYGFPWEVDVALTGIIFIVMGRWLKNIVQRIKNNLLLTLIVGIFCLCINTIIAPLNYTDDNQYIMAYAAYGVNYYVYLVNAIIASIGLILLCTFFEKSAIIKWMGINSNGIMILHYFIFEFTTNFANQFVQYNQILAAGILAVSTIALCFPIINLLHRVMPGII